MMTRTCAPSDIPKFIRSIPSVIVWATRSHKFLQTAPLKAQHGRVRAGLLCAKLSTMRNARIETSEFTSGERAYIRGELDQFMSTLPTVAEGFMLKTWRGGPKARQPKLSAIAQGLVERGLMRLDPVARPPRLFFTEVGLVALREMMADRRFADPRKFAHIRQELGIEPRLDE
jgi:hypothetical protein